MATYNVTDYVGQTITGFDVTVDVLAFGNVAHGPASAVSYNLSGDDLTITAANGETVTLAGVAYTQITTSNVTFLDGSSIFVGDKTSDAFADAADATATAVASTAGDYVHAGGGANDLDINIAGNHFVQGDAGNDDMDIGAAAAANGNNTMRGGSGNDTIVAAQSSGNHLLKGDLGADDITIAATATGNSSVYGGDGTDTISVAGTGNNTVFGDAGVDDIDLEATASGNNTVNGGAGVDDIDVVGASSGDHFIRGGGDGDSIDSSATSTGNITIWGDLGDDTITAAGAGNHTIYGDNLNNLTQSGADTIQLVGASAAGSNMINGMAGNDTLDIDVAAGAAGANTIRGGSGNDSFDVDVAAVAAGSFLLRGDLGVDAFDINFGAGAAQDNITVEGGDGVDTFTITYDGFANILTLSDWDDATEAVNITNGDTAAALTVSRAAGTTVVTGASGDQTRFNGSDTNFNSTNFTVDGGGVLWTNFGGAATTLTGTAGADQLIGGNNGDTFAIGAAGAVAGDVITGGTGDDTFGFELSAQLNALSGATLAGGEGTDTIVASEAAALAVANADWANVTGIEALAMNSNAAHVVELGGNGQTAGIATVTTTSTTGVNVDGSAYTTLGLTMTGSTGDDTLTGGAAGDALTGGAGADDLIGNAGVDTLIGGAGADDITGGDGNDVLTGGDDADTFIFAATAAANDLDTITDFGTTDLLNFTAFGGSAVTAVLADTSVANQAVADNNVFVITDADGSLDTAAEIAALFGGGGKVFNTVADPCDVVLFIQNSTDTHVWYVDNAGDTAVAAGEVVQVATLTGYTTTIESADLV